MASPTDYNAALRAAHVVGGDDWCDWDADPVVLGLLPKLMPAEGYYNFYKDGSVVHMKKIRGTPTVVKKMGAKKLPVLPEGVLNGQHVCTMFEGGGGCRTLPGCWRRTSLHSAPETHRRTRFINLSYSNRSSLLVTAAQNPDIISIDSKTPYTREVFTELNILYLRAAVTRSEDRLE